MSPHRSSDKELKKLLNQYCILSNEPSKKQELLQELKRRLHSPALITGCDFIPMDHSLMKEAIILSDAFESLTNGMLDEKTLPSLQSISEDSLLQPWSSFVKGVHSFYSRDYEACMRQMREIPSDSAPGGFLPFFEHLLGGGRDSELPSQWRILKDSVIENSRIIQDSLDLIKESADMEDLLLESAGLLIRDIIRDNRASAQKILLWCFERLQVSDILSDTAVLRGRQLFGEEDGYRLAALASLSYDPDRSLVYWLHSLLSCLMGSDAAATRARAYLGIIRDVSETVQIEFELTDEYIRLIHSLVKELSEKILHIHPELTEGSDLPEDPFEAISRLSGKNKKQNIQRKIRGFDREAVQLELFAL